MFPCGIKDLGGGGLRALFLFESIGASYIEQYDTHTNPGVAVKDVSVCCCCCDPVEKVQQQQQENQDLYLCTHHVYPSAAAD